MISGVMYFIAPTIALAVLFLVLPIFIPLYEKYFNWVISVMMRRL
jgi:hypothetical protein